MIAIATRGSALALAQARIAIERLRTLRPDLDLALEVIDADGDLRPDSPVPELEGQGWFSSRLETALAEGRVGAAVHSAKDLPSELPPGLGVAAFLTREDPRDSIVVAGGQAWRTLPAGARVGTSSPRRAAQLQAIRPDLQLVPMRGNLDTRLLLVAESAVAAAMVARAGLLRIGRPEVGEVLDPHLECTPAPAQGAIAIEVAVGSEMAKAVAPLDDPVTRLCVEVERRVLRRLGGGCRLPLGALAEKTGEDLFLLSCAWCPGPAGEAVIRRSGNASALGLPALAERLADELVGDG